MDGQRVGRMSVVSVGGAGGGYGDGGYMGTQDPLKGQQLIGSTRAWTFGFSPKYLCSIPGILRLVNICLGIICFGLWLPGYPSEFKGQHINQINDETEGGYGEGWSREPLCEFVLAAIIICLLFSLFFFFALLCTKTAYWNRFNKFSHLGLSIFLLTASICSVFGVWYFNENCCHVQMDWEGLGLSVSLAGGDYFYSRHCYCYLTRYNNYGQDSSSYQTETVLYEATKNTDLTGFDHHWTFTAHHMRPHLAAIFFLFLNSIVYFLGFLFSKLKRN